MINPLALNMTWRNFSVNMIGGNVEHGTKCLFKIRSCFSSDIECVDVVSDDWSFSLIEVDPCGSGTKCNNLSAIKDYFSILVHGTNEPVMLVILFSGFSLAVDEWNLEWLLAEKHLCVCTEITRTPQKQLQITKTVPSKVSRIKQTYCQTSWFNPASNRSSSVEMWNANAKLFNDVKIVFSGHRWML